MTQAEGLALEAERSLGRRPLRRTDLLAQRGLDESGLITFWDEKSVISQMTDYAGVRIL
jgi:hypothetical protein